MAAWDAAQYLKFEAERTQPSRDLAARITVANPSKVIDMGCGPGNSTQVLFETFCGASITGVDSSAEMVAVAKKAHPQLTFVQMDASGDVSALGKECDVVFSNACIQWIPNHERLLPNWLALLRSGGQLAVQTPLSNKQAIHAAVLELAQSARWRQYFENPRWSQNLAPGAYFELLAESAAYFTMWETIYYHTMATHKDIIEWYRGTGLRPYIDALPKGEVPVFLDAVLREVEKLYPMQKNGQVVFCFPRLFFVATAK